MAIAASSVASPCGLPVSRNTRSASCANRRVITPFQVRRCSARSSKVSADHHTASSRAASTAPRTSSALATGWTPTTSPVRGSSESKVASPPESPGVSVRGSSVRVIGCS